MPPDDPAESSGATAGRREVARALRGLDLSAASRGRTDLAGHLEAARTDLDHLLAALDRSPAPPAAVVRRALDLLWQVALLRAAGLVDDDPPTAGG